MKTNDFKKRILDSKSRFEGPTGQEKLTPIAYVSIAATEQSLGELTDFNKLEKPAGDLNTKEPRASRTLEDLGPAAGLLLLAQSATILREVDVDSLRTALSLVGTYAADSSGTVYSFADGKEPTAELPAEAPNIAQPLYVRDGDKVFAVTGEPALTAGLGRFVMEPRADLSGGDGNFTPDGRRSNPEDLIPAFPSRDELIQLQAEMRLSKAQRKAKTSEPLLPDAERWGIVKSEENANSTIFMGEDVASPELMEKMNRMMEEESFNTVRAKSSARDISGKPAADE